MKKWLERFIEEKGLDTDFIFEVEHEGMVHFVEFNFLIDLILHSSKGEQEKIKSTIVYIDFKNGDVMHFLNHLATGYIKTNY